MKRAAKKIAKYAAFGLLALLVAGIVAPSISAERYRNQIQAALKRALGREVEIGAVHFNVFTGVGFAAENVTIHEDPSVGVEPIAYVGSLEATPRLWSLFTRRLEFASIRLDDASINLSKTGPASQPGRWNFEPLLNRSLVMTFPEIHVRNGRINFKFGDTKSVFYLIDTDLDIDPPARGGYAWSVRFSGGPARTDRPARPFGALAATGRWTAAFQGHPDRLDLDVQLEKSQLSEIVALVRGHDAGVHGTVSSRMRLSGPPDNISITGRLVVEDVHRWDLLPPHGQGWPLDVSGRLNLMAQTLELESSSNEREALPLSVRFRAGNYLSQPQWAVSANWNRFPVAPLMELARHMGAQLPPKLSLAGWLDGAAAYDSQTGMQGELSFHDTAVTIPDSAPVRFEQAKLLFDAGGVKLAPALVRTSNDDQAQIEGSYRWDEPSLDLAISTKDMNVESLRSQVALAAVPWLEQVPSGLWSGQLRYHYAPLEEPSPDASPQGGWSGQIQVADAKFPVQGLAELVTVESARVQIQGARIAADRIHARAGKVAAEGEYRYEPGAPRPHRIRLTIPEADAADLERILSPTLQRTRGLLARAFSFGRGAVPEWLAARHVEGTVQVGSLTLAGTRITKLRARLLWDGTRARMDNLTARVEDGTGTGVLTVNLRAPKPSYLLTGRVKTMSCKSGKLDAEGVIETRGTGLELLVNLRSQGTFAGRALAIGSVPQFESVSGTYRLAWAQPEPRLTLRDLRLAEGENVYTGSGATQDDGRLLILLSGGGKEMRMSGTLAKLRLDEPTVP